MILIFVGLFPLCRRTCLWVDVSSFQLGNDDMTTIDPHILIYSHTHFPNGRKCFFKLKVASAGWWRNMSHCRSSKCSFFFSFVDNNTHVKCCLHSYAPAQVSSTAERWQLLVLPPSFLLPPVHVWDCGVPAGGPAGMCRTRPFAAPASKKRKIINKNKVESSCCCLFPSVLTRCAHASPVSYSPIFFLTLCCAVVNKWQRWRATLLLFSS